MARAILSRSVDIPSVTTIVLTPTYTISRPLIAPADTPTATATTDATATPQWSKTVRTGISVAHRPKIEATERSTNSPTITVHRKAMERKTKADCELKIVWKVPLVSKFEDSTA